METKRIAIDTSKHVFTLHGVDEWDHPVLRRNQVEAFFKKQAATEVVLEACGGSHHWGRTLAALGHRVRLIPPQYVKPFVKRGKNDRNDAEAISEAAARPSMRSVPIKSATAQAAADATVPAPAKEMFEMLGKEVARLDETLAELDRKLAAMHKTNSVSRLLAEVPGIGPLGALTLALTVDARQFKGCQTVQVGAALCRLDRIDPPRNTPPAASSGWAASAGRATKGCASCWCLGRPR